jgi:isopentenyl phosphate kinase
MKELVFLKLGGSLITDKTQPYTPRLDVINNLAVQVETALRTHPGLRLVIGHGAGSFGHVPASEYRTRDGLPPRATPLTHRERDETEGSYWKGFAEVWYQASALNRFVMKALRDVHVRTISLSPVSSVIASNGDVSVWETTPLRMAVSAGIVPVIHGDVAFDEVRGGTILSTEDLFGHLARALNPDRILLAGLEPAVWADFPSRNAKLSKITPQTFHAVNMGMGRSEGTDVTGGMDSKVRQMLSLVQDVPGLTVQVFSGNELGNLVKALTGETLGTIITAQ